MAVIDIYFFIVAEIQASMGRDGTNTPLYVSICYICLFRDPTYCELTPKAKRKDREMCLFISYLVYQENYNGICWNKRKYRLLVLASLRET